MLEPRDQDSFHYPHKRKKISPSAPSRDGLETSRVTRGLRDFGTSFRPAMAEAGRLLRARHVRGLCRDSGLGPDAGLGPDDLTGGPGTAGDH